MIGLHEKTVKKRWMLFNGLRLLLQIGCLFFVISLVLNVMERFGFPTNLLSLGVLLVLGLDRLHWQINIHLDPDVLQKAKVMNLLHSTQELWKFHVKSILKWSLAFLTCLTLSYTLAWDTVDHHRAQWASLVQFRASLDIHRGARMEQTRFQLSKAFMTRIQLLEDNILELNVRDPRSSLEVRLERASGEVFQSFLIQHKSDGAFQLNFTISESLILVIDQPVVSFEVERVPVPEIEAELLTKVEDVISDDQELLFYYHAKSLTPLDRLEIVVQTQHGPKRELVVSVLDDSLLEQEGNYDIVLDRFMSEDQEELTLFFEATDRSKPVQFVGRSEPITLNVVSAYGRYRMALSKLAEIRSTLEDMDQPYPDFKDVQRLTDKSPFFDSMDRVTLARFASRDPKERLSLAADIGDFLYEHEQMDQRERDRDFFIALRTLSRAIENPKRLNPEPIRLRMADFLEERSRVWSRRVEELGENPELWPEIVEDLKSRIIEVREQRDINHLSQRYQQWLDQIESLEDKKKEEQEQQRQENMVSILEELRELRRSQADVSKKLDRADLNRAQIEQEWSMTRAQQMTNSKSTSSLEAKVRGMSPSAAKRLQYAKKAMDQAVELGEARNFEGAETEADMAGRLLIEAQQKANQQTREQRRRRISGNQYHGRNVDGGDVVIERQYQVDERYRQGILREVNESMQGLDEPAQNFLKDYLRQVVK